MKAITSTFRFGLKQISRDYMLLLLLLAPIFCGAAFRFLIPLFDRLLEQQFGVSELLQPYYVIFDTLLPLMAPTMICIIASFQILEERDDQVASYLFVTPIGYKGYITARLVIPTMFSFLVALLVIVIFQLTSVPLLLATMLSLVSALSALVISLLVVSYANNKVEGLALTKLMGLSFLGMLAPYFIDGGKQYIFAVLPSFWVGRVMIDYGNSSWGTSILGGIISSSMWIYLVYQRFKRRIS